MTAQADTFAIILAIKLIDRYGIPSAASVVANRTFDAATGSYTGGTTTNKTPTVSPPVRYTEQMKPTDVALLEASLIYMKGNEDFEPYKGLVITINGKAWKVLQVDPLVSGVQVAAYRLWVKA